MVDNNKWNKENIGQKEDILGTISIHDQLWKEMIQIEILFKSTLFFSILSIMIIESWISHRILL